MSRRRWATATYRLARVCGNDRVLSLACAWQAWKLGPEVVALLAMAEPEHEQLFIAQDYIDAQREASLMQ